MQQSDGGPRESSLACADLSYSTVFPRHSNSDSCSRIAGSHARSHAGDALVVAWRSSFSLDSQSSALNLEISRPVPGHFVVDLIAFGRK